MKPIRHILVATDFSPASARAVDTAAALADRFDARLTIAHVLPSVPYPYPVPVQDELHAEAQQRLDRLTELLRARASRPMGVLRHGVAWEEILLLARQLDVDLTVVGSHGRRGLPHLLLGSVAEKIVRHSSGPVLTVHSWRFEDRQHAGRELANALYSIRGEMPAVVALSPSAVLVAVEVARELGTSLDVLLTRSLEYDGVFGAACEAGTTYVDPDAAEALNLLPTERERIALMAGRDLRDEAQRLRGSRPIGELWRRTVILVSDGLATPWSALAAAKALSTMGVGRIITATPIGVPSALETVQREMGDLVFVESIPERTDIATAYRDFTIPSERAVIEALRTPLPVVA